MPTQNLPNPFPGLRSFELNEDYLFFGREPQTAELVKRLRQNRFLAVVGTSGSGKSSLVRAGMIPTLLAGRMRNAGSRWEIAVMRPGGHPIGHLAQALCDADLYDPEVESMVPHLQATLSRSRLGLVEAVRQSEMEPDTNLLLVVDQFEEIFRFRSVGHQEREQALDFVNLLLEASRQKDAPVYVVITMRSDFIGDCSQFEGLAEAVNDGEFLIPRLSRQQCRAAIEGPVKVAGGQISSSLVQRLLNDLGEDQDELPILQHALMRTWDHWTKRVSPPESAAAIDLEDYEAIGGMSEALSRHADEVFESLPDARHRQVAERLFQALTERGSDNRGIRRPTRLRQLGEIGAATENEVTAVIEAFRAPGVTFLMPPAQVKLQSQTVIDISHESLMRVWQRLGRWVEDEAQSARIYGRLADSAHLHQEGKAGLYRDPDLQIALSWRETTQPTDAWARRYHDGFEIAVAFLEESHRSKQAGLAAKEAARRKELEQAQALAQAQRLRLKEQQHAAIRLKWLVRGLGLVAMVALAALLMALTSSKLAQDNERRAQDNAAEAKRHAQRAKEQRLLAESATRDSRRQVYQSDMNLAAQAHAAGDIARLDELLDKHWPEPWETEDLRGFEWYHWWQATHLHVGQVPPGSPLGGIAFSPDLRLFAVEGWPGRVWVRSVSGHSLVTPEIEIGAADLAFSPDGRSLILGSSDRISLFDTNTWTRRDIAVPGGGQIHDFAFSPTQSLMASGGRADTITVWSTETWEPVGQPLQAGGFVRSLAFSRDGKSLIAAMNDSRVVVWDLATRSIRQILTGHSKSVRRVACSPVADLFATGSTDETVRLWNGDYELIDDFDAFGPVTVLEFSPDGQQLLAGTSVNNSLVIWHLRNQQPAMKLAHVIKGHSRAVNGAAFLPGTNLLVSISDDGSSKTWNLARCEPSMDLGEINMRVPSWAEPSRLTYAHDGSGLWVTDPDGKLYWSSLDLPAIVESPDPDGFHTFAITKDGAWQAGVTENGQIGVWDVRRGELLARHPTLASDVGFVVVSSGGPTVAWKSQHDVHVWNVNRNTTRALGMAAAGLPALSPNGDRVAVHEWATTSVWDVTVDPPLLLWRGYGWGPESWNVFSPDGNLVAVASYNNHIRLHDAETGELIATLKGHTASVRSLDFSPDGRRLVSGGDDRAVRIWDVETAQLLSSFVNYEGAVASVAFSPGGDSVASVAFPPGEDSVAPLRGDGTVRIWTASSLQEVDQHVEHWIERARTYTGLRRWDQALAMLDESLKHNPQAPTLLLARSDLYRQQGNWAAAISDITQAIALAPTDGTLFKQRADLRLDKGLRSEAIADYAKAITLTANIRGRDALEQIQQSLSLGSVLVPTASEWRHTTTEPGGNWQDPDHFDDQDWQLGRAPFGSDIRDSGPDPNSPWRARDRELWLRHKFEVSEIRETDLVFRAYVDDEVELYLNGVLAAEAVWVGPRYQILRGAAAARLRPGGNVLALHVVNTNNYGKIEVGLYQRGDELAFAEVLSRALTDLPRDPQLNRAAGEFDASQHRWSEATAHFRRLIELSPQDEQDWMRTAALLVAAGELDEYHRVCKEMLDRFQAPGAQEIAERVAKACLFVPPAESDLQAAAKLAQESVADPNHWATPYAMITRGLADYRTGNFRGAKDWSQQGLQQPPTWFVEAQANLVLAMSEFQLNETGAARDSLAAAKSVLSTHAEDYRIGTLGESWHDWLFARALLREAEALLNDQ